MYSTTIKSTAFFVSWTGKLMKKTADEKSLSRMKISSTMDAEKVFIGLRKNTDDSYQDEVLHFLKQIGTPHLLSESQR